MARYLQQARTRFDWRTTAEGANSLSGMSGNRAALIVAGEMASELSDEKGGASMHDLTQQLLGDHERLAPEGIS